MLVARPSRLTGPHFYAGPAGKTGEAEHRQRLWLELAREALR